ncbi:hypothetical protein HPG69_017280 [Diceros bicornis minor]|uniref:Uncharacterized protein n=1 Tax=Diceros bicornis minor TaxID=77932 RepID=A0A7J7ED26_DICBM|nr:hypothetical protein HPG69_017280 [Diceros bicornis minor]
MPLKKQNEGRRIHLFHYPNDNRVTCCRSNYYISKHLFPSLTKIEDRPAPQDSRHLVYLLAQQPARPPAAFIYTCCSVLNKSRTSRNSNYWFLPENKSIVSPFPAPRATILLIPIT